MERTKYPRTYHFPFSPGATNDDKIQHDWEGILAHELVLTEKLDGENTCLKAKGVFARSHGAPTRNPWAQNMWPVWERIKRDLDDLEIFGENLYGVHSIEYQRLPDYFFVFAARKEDRWLSWAELQDVTFLLDLRLVPTIGSGRFNAKDLQQRILSSMAEPSILGAEREGFVVRVASEFNDELFSNNVLKYVRANHVQTDEHWTRNWRKAQLYL
ncbi:MAG: RNA ligase family protein [Bacteroidota bacterium]